jgi:dTDP-4-dehydrorhamnose 3,5-epimerase
MTSNLIVPVGKVRFVFIGDDPSDRLEVVSGDGAHKRLHVPPGFWMAFSGAAPGPNLVVNIADIPHDDNEEDRQSVTAFKFYKV